MYVIQLLSYSRLFCLYVFFSSHLSLSLSLSLSLAQSTEAVEYTGCISAER